MNKTTEENIQNVVDEMFKLQKKSNEFIKLLTHDDTLSENLILLLLKLKLYGHMKITEIAEGFMLTPGAATNMCDKLEELQLVERVRIKDDRRVVRVSLTNEGETKIASIFSKFSDEQLMNISDILKDINKVFDKITK
ncbi:MULTISPECIES: MarR family winged helix-turn-helix transcriptional regulator [Bacillus]|uniref:MarR family winged helix-turn-helix transcriptional regulator n=1 Tax=Bacillus TaxID=1386 RepID=UPI0002DD77E5|nr:MULTISPECIES: MarR family transcriptional regulator [Bacillus]